MLFYKNSNFSRTLIFIAILICGLYVGQVASGSTELKSIVSGYGYLGLFIVSVVAGFNLAVPMPAVALMPLFMESGLSFSISILIMTAGMTVADIIAFALARLGRKLATKSFGNEFFRKIDFFRDKFSRNPKGLPNMEFNIVLSQ
jgi:membrane protein DedA with SNARE-associated domain